MIHQLRQEYHSASLSANDMATSPFDQFHAWFQAALEAGVQEPNAMTLSTATLDGQPRGRVVLLKDYGPSGFSFFTNFGSRKGAEIDENPKVSLTFLWLDLHRQIRIEGIAERLPKSESEAYFQSRPRGSQVGAWASPQSTVIQGRSWLLERVEALEKKHEGQEVLPLPEFWGGYLVKPTLFEFWQGQVSRLHDRFEYLLNGDGTWLRQRLAP
jgi:pyridoxamine 5'-phosphate oxidase